MATLKRQGHLELWTDHEIRPGDSFDSSISAALEAADLVLLLVSPDFMASNYCVSIEMARALERERAGECRVVPIILVPCDWSSSEIGGLKALPTDAKPVTKFQTLDEGLHDVVTQLRALLTKPASNQPFPKHATTAGAPATAVDDSDRTFAGFPAAQPPMARRASNLNLPKKFTDLDRAEFVRGGYDYILEYFTNSLKELEARNAHIQTRIRPETSSFFVATIFSDGKKVSGCGIRLGGFSSSNGINYLASDDPSQSKSSNEQLSLVEDKFNLGWRSLFGAAFSGRDSKGSMTHEGAANHLWDMFVERLHQ
jgi:hypothetical protein